MSLASLVNLRFSRKKDGTYTISFSAGAVGEYRVIARLDNIEMPPLPLQFVEGSSSRPTEADKALAAAKAESKHASTKSRRADAADEPKDSADVEDAGEDVVDVSEASSR